MKADAAADFTALIGQHHRLIYKVANSYARGSDDVDDLAQEIATQAWRGFRSFDAARSFSTWLYRVALNVAISWVRTEGPRRNRTVPYDPDLHEPSTRDEVADDDGLRLLRSFLEAQAPLDRAVLLLYLDERPMADIADILGLTATHVTTKINRLKERLRAFAAQEETHGTR